MPTPLRRVERVGSYLESHMTLLSTVVEWVPWMVTADCRWRGRVTWKEWTKAFPLRRQSGQWWERWKCMQYLAVTFRDLHPPSEHIKLSAVLHPGVGHHQGAGGGKGALLLPVGGDGGGAHPSVREASVSRKVPPCQPWPCSWNPSWSPVMVMLRSRFTTCMVAVVAPSPLPPSRT